MSLERFVEAQHRDFPMALREIENSRKETHWMWYIFPQLQGLWRSDMAQFYAIADLDEAKAYLAHTDSFWHAIKISAFQAVQAVL